MPDPTLHCPWRYVLCRTTWFESTSLLCTIWFPMQHNKSILLAFRHVFRLCSKLQALSPLSLPACPCKVFSVAWWMRHWGAPTPKRSKAFSNSPHIGQLHQGRLKKQPVADEHKTTVQYYDSSGRKRYKGSRALKGTQHLVLAYRCECNTLMYI